MSFVENEDNGEIVLIWTGVCNFNEFVLKPESNEGVIFVMGTELISVLKLFELNGSYAATGYMSAPMISIPRTS